MFPAVPKDTRRAPRRPCRTLEETPAEAPENQISSESLAEGCDPRMVTLRKGFSADSRKIAEKCAKPHFLCKKCAIPLGTL